MPERSSPSPEGLRETYDRIAEDWHRDHHTDDWWAEGIAQFISLLPAGASILDAGCGPGEKSAYFAERGFRVTGFDFSGAMIAIAEREVSDASFRVCDLADADSLPGTYDAIFMQAVLLHVPRKDAAAAVARLARKLNARGYFYIAVKEKRSDREEEQVVQEDDYGYPYERFFSYYTPGEIKAFCAACGLSIEFENVSRAGRANWIQVIARK